MPDQTTDRSEMTDILSRDGRIVHVNAAEETRLGLAPGTATGQPWSLIYTLAAREQLEYLFSQTEPGPHVLTLEMRGAGGALETTAIATLQADEMGEIRLRTVKWPTSGALKDIARLAEENAVLSSILEASDDAGWCMEWADPVDLSAPEQEIIRQVFDNGPRWRLCNGAMARLYRTPEGQDFNTRPVHETFPRTRENEDFVRRLIHADFDVSGSPSRDLRYDGMFIEVENDVRGHIRGNRLYRMWGTVRDVSKHARRTAVLREEIDALEAMLDGLPEALLVLDAHGQLLHANLAAEELFGLPRDRLLDRMLPDLLEQPVALAELQAIAEAHMPGRPPRMLPVQLRLPGKTLRGELAVRGLNLRGEPCLAVSFRLRLGLRDPSGDPAGDPAGAPAAGSAPLRLRR